MERFAEPHKLKYQRVSVTYLDTCIQSTDLTALPFNTIMGKLAIDMVELFSNQPITPGDYWASFNLPGYGPSVLPIRFNYCIPCHSDYGAFLSCFSFVQLPKIEYQKIAAFCRKSSILKTT